MWNTYSLTRYINTTSKPPTLNSHYIPYYYYHMLGYISSPKRKIIELIKERKGSISCRCSTSTLNISQHSFGIQRFKGWWQQLLLTTDNERQANAGRAKRKRKELENESTTYILLYISHNIHIYLPIYFIYNILHCFTCLSLSDPRKLDLGDVGKK